MASYILAKAIQLGVNPNNPGANLGLTFTAQLIDYTGEPVGGLIATGFTELGGGNYAWAGEIPDETFRGTIKFVASNGKELVHSVNPAGGGSGGASGLGLTVVDHNYGGTDNYAYRTTGGVGVMGAMVMAFLQEDYDAGRRSAEYAAANTVTAASGRWAGKMALNPGDYTLVFVKPGSYGPDTAALTVS